MKKTETKIPFFLAFKFLTRGNKWTLGLIIFFIAIAFINMVFIASLFNGIIEGFNQQIIDTYAGHILVMPKANEDAITDVNELIINIKNTEEVLAASARTVVPGFLKYGSKKGNWQINAINPDDEKQVTVIADKIVSGSYLSPYDSDQIILGKSIIGDSEESDSLFSLPSAKIGDKISIVYGQAAKEFTIKGIFHTKFINVDEQAFITEEALLEINPLYRDTANNIAVKIGETGDEEEVIANLRANGIKEELHSWEKVSNLMESISDSFLSINFILSTVGVLIAAITVFIVIYIDISGKRKQIGILRAIGVKPYIIQLAYVILTSIYAVAGVILGSALFFLIVVPYFNAYPFELPIADATLHINYADYIIRLESIIWVAIFAGLVPAIMITRIKILDAIWGH